MKTVKRVKTEEKTKTEEKKFKYAQSCDSVECRTRYKKDFLFIDECPATAHELNFIKKEKTCLLCGKVTKYKG